MELYACMQACKHYLWTMHFLPEDYVLCQWIYSTAESIFRGFVICRFPPNAMVNLSHLLIHQHGVDVSTQSDLMMRTTLKTWLFFLVFILCSRACSVWLAKLTAHGDIQDEAEKPNGT
jgi:hypothetical protein